MAKDINIHLKTTGEQQVRSNLDSVGTSAKNVGSDVQAGGQQAADGMGQMTGSAQQTGSEMQNLGQQTESTKKSMLGNLKELAGGLGFAGLAMGAVAALRKITAALDDMRAAAGEAVRDLAELQRSSADFFEAMDAYTPEERAAALRHVRDFQAATGLSQDQSRDMLEVQMRSFGTLDHAALDQWAGYQQLHGGAATLDLMRWAGGQGITDVQRQGQIQRMISAVAGQTGLRDSEIIEGITRYSTEYGALGWSPEQTIMNIGTAISGLAPAESRRALRSMASGLSQLDEASALGAGADAETAADSQARFAWAMQQIQDADPADRPRIARELFGAGGVYVARLATGEMSPEARRAVMRAASPEGAADEAARVAGVRETAEGTIGKAEGVADAIGDQITEEETIDEAIRTIGRAHLAYLKRTDRIRYNKIRTMKIHGEEAVAEYAARDRFEQEFGMFEEDAGALQKFVGRSQWARLSPEERLDMLNETKPPVINNFNYSQHQNYYPSTGDRQDGPRIQGGVQ